MNRVKLVVTETFQSVNEEERKQNLQKAVDRYLLNTLRCESNLTHEADREN